MDSFTYTNIFETKGIEYLIIIGFLLLLIPFWIIINKPIKFHAKLGEALGVLSASILRIPQGLFYSKNHTWTYLEPSGNAKVGLNDLLVHLTGVTALNNLLIAGERINKGDVIAELRQDNKTLRIVSPISGKIESVNTMLKENPEAINADPYGNGWLYKINPESWKTDTNPYLMANEAKQWLNMELARFKDFAAITMGRLSTDSSMAILQEGGELTDNPLAEMPTEVWRDFQSQFLDTLN